MMSTVRLRALACFRTLHRSIKLVFHEDQSAIKAGKIRINEEFRKNLNISDEFAINELIRSGEDTAVYLKTCVVQAKLNDQNAYEVQLTKDTAMQTNWPYMGGDSALPDETKKKRDRAQRKKMAGDDSDRCPS